MVHSNLVFSYDTTDGKENPYAIFDRDSGYYQDHEDNDDLRQDSVIESYSHEDFDNLFDGEAIDQNLEDNDDLRQDSVIEKVNHEDFDSLVLDEENHQDYEDNDNLRQESAIHSVSHEDFDKLVEEASHDDSRQESAIHNISHKDFDNIVNGEIKTTYTATGLRTPAGSAQTSPPENSVARIGASGSMVPGNLRAPVLPKKALSQADSDESANLKGQILTNDTYAAFLLLVSLVISVLAFRALAGRRRSRKRRSDIYSYLASFDVGDVDLQRAITGGWHGTYKNGLAEGFDFDPDYYSDDYGETDEDSFDNSYNDSYTDSFDDSDGSFNAASSGHTLYFHDEGDFSSFQVADKNIYFADDIDLDDIDDDLDDDGDSANSDVFAPVRTRAF